jgi:predicted transcriptional regulator
MTSRRSKLEIYVDIMEEIRSGTILPTKIMYAANLSWKPLQQILKSLVSQKLIEECTVVVGDKRTKTAYRLTEKGQNVLHYFRKAEALVEKESPAEIRNWA